MRTRKVMLGGVILGIVAVFGLGLALAQEGPSRGRGRTPEQMRERSLERIKEALAPTDDEWKALEPKLDKVLTLAREAGVSSMRRTFGRRQGSDATPAEGPQSDVAQATQNLVKTLANKEAKPEEIKAKLTGLRDARKKAMAALATARKSVGETVKLRQEAQLVLMGVID